MGGGCVGDDRGASASRGHQMGLSGNQRLGRGSWWGRRCRQRCLLMWWWLLPGQVGRRQGHRLGRGAWVGRQRCRGSAGWWLRQLRVGAMAQFRWAQTSLVLLHILVYVVLTLCGGPQGQGQVRRAWEIRSWRSRCPGGLGNKGWGIFSSRQRKGQRLAFEGQR